MRIGLISDTHGFLDEAIFSYFAETDEIWHAGDFGSLEVLQRLRDFKLLRGVYGKIDGPEVRAETASEIEWECDGLGVYMTHAGGYPGHYDSQAKKGVRQTPARPIRLRPFPYSESMRDPVLGLLHMNPGACGRNGWHTIRTLLRFSVDSGKISAVEAIELGPRTERRST